MTTVCTTDLLPLRFHHLACLRHFVGEGYSEAFTARMTVLTALLREPARGSSGRGSGPI